MIAVIIPTLNEEKAIRSVIEGFPSSYRDHDVEVFVVDGGSEDNTREIAVDLGAEVVNQRLGGGKGSGVRQALDEIDAEIYIMIDGDSTYDPGELGRIADPIIDNEAEHVIGRRSNREKGSIHTLNLLGNRIFNLITRVSTGEQVTDMLSGYRAFTKESVEHTYFTQPGFGIETEMTFSALENNVPIKEVDISYSRRKGESKLNPLRDGWRIINTIIWSIRDLNPLMFFSSISLGLLLLSIYPAYATLQQRMEFGVIEHPGTAIAAGVLLILAVQFFVFGMLADQIRNTEKRLRNHL